MRVLVIAEKRKNVSEFVETFNSKGIRARYLRILKISLVTKFKNTLIKSMGEDIPRYDAVFLQARLSLAPFIEPLLEELASKGVYVNCKPGSYFIGENEPYKFVCLSASNVATPRTLTSGSAKNIERVSKKISYPLLAKSFVGMKTQQALVVENEKQLNSFVNSIKQDMDGFMLREFIEDDIISCVVIGQKVFAVRRKLREHIVDPVEKGVSVCPSESEKQEAIKAATACGYDIARVDLVKGRVIDVTPNVSWKKFNLVCSSNLEEAVANFYFDKIAEVGPKKNFADDLSELKKIVSGTFFGKIFK